MEGMIIPVMLDAVEVCVMSNAMQTKVNAALTAWYEAR